MRHREKAQVKRYNLVELYKSNLIIVYQLSMTGGFQNRAKSLNKPLQSTS